jgi:hypothetical protein
LQDLQTLLAFHNPWWLTGRVPQELNLPFRRPAFANIFDYLKLDRVIILKGPRRTGKSTLIFQLLHELLQQGIDSHRLLYLPFDDPDFNHSFNDIVLAFEKQLGREISQGPEVYLFFDEVQHLDNWSGYLKKYVDKKWPIKFVVSGSSASLIKQGAESLAGRTVEEIVLPFSFFEFLLYHLDENEAGILRDLHTSFKLEKADVPAQASLVERKLAILFEKYLSLGGFPSLYGIQEPFLRKKLLQEDIIEKVIYRDLVKRYGIKKPGTLEKLFLYLVNQSSDMLNIASVSNSFKLSRDSTQEYVQYLRESFLIMMTPRFAPSIETSLRANPKVHVIDSGLMEAFSRLPVGKRVESIVARHLYFMNQSYFHNRWEVDLVIRQDDHIIPIEVKFREKVGNEDLAGLRALQTKTPFAQAIVVTKDYKGEQDNVVFIPAHLFLALI